MRSEAIRPGDVIAGKYRVRTILGRSRGFLVEAFHTEFDQRVVIRVLSPALCDDKEIERFRREARTLAKLESEHVARIIDVGTLPDGSFYLVRQFLEGTDLATHLKKSGPLPLQQAVLFILQASEAVAQTHVHNIVLRELQPSHLFLAQRVGGSPVVKIIDFGTAKLMREAAAPTAGLEATATAMFGMSPYSSPEIIRKAKSVDARTDVWSLGCILYEMLAARPAFLGEMAALMLAITKEDPAPLTSIRRDLPPELNQIIGWALAKDVDGRFANVYGFAHALTPFAPPEGQVLIQRIGEITTAAQQKKERPVYAAPAPIAPASKGSGDEDAPTFVDAVLEESTGVKPSPQGGAGESPLDRTMFMGNDYVAPSPGPPGMNNAPRAGAQPPGPSPMPGFGAAPPVRPSQQQAASPQPGGQQGSLLGPSLQLDGGARRASMGSWHDVSGISGAAPPGANTPAAAKPAASPDFAYPAAQKGKNKNTIILAVAGAVVGLTLLAGVVVFTTGGESEGGKTPASAESGTSSAGSAPTPKTADTGTPTPESSGTPAPPPTSEPVASAPSTTTSTPAAPANTPGPTQAIPTPQVPTSKPTSTGTTPKPTSTATSSPPPDTGGMGTLVAVAVGGSCAFSVNGASKGSGATIKVQLKPGSYSVSCKPVSGATKSKSVTVTSGGTAMAMFKL